MTDIIILTYGQEDFTVKCFDSILAHTEDYRLVWVDNGSSIASRNAVMPAFLKHQNRLSIWSGQNLGFVKGCNLALRAVMGTADIHAEYIVLQNNDTEATAGWLKRLILGLQKTPTAWAIGPTTSTDQSWQGVRNIMKTRGYLFPNELNPLNRDEVCRLLNITFEDRTENAKMVAFFCTLFRREAFEQLGLLDERFGVGFGDDDDFTTRIIKSGHKVLYMPGVYVLHHHRTTFKSVYGVAAIKGMQEEAMKVYKHKHNLK